MKHLNVDPQVFNALLQLYTATTGIPVHFYQDEQIVTPKESEINYPEYCKLICKHFEDGDRCKRDHKRIGRSVRDEGFAICHAGMYIYTKPIVNESSAVGALLCGHFRLSSTQRDIVARQYLESTLSEIINVKIRNKIKQKYGQIDAISESDIADQLELFQQLCSIQDKLANFRYEITTLENEQIQIERGIENIAHEFQIRLQALYADSENLLDALRTENLADPDTLEISKELIRGVKRLNVLVQNLSLGLGEYSVENFYLSAIIRDSIDLYRNEAMHKNVVFQVNIEEPSVIEASRIHVIHLMNNLVANAVKYSYSGRTNHQRFIRVEGKRGYEQYEILVQNFGVGILPDEIEQIFEKGYRGILTRDEKRTGAGLGLSISREIVDRHRGKILVTSKPAGNAHLTTFRVLLPYIWHGRRSVQ